MIDTQKLILSEDQVRKMLRRIAFEIYENNFDEKRLTVVGIHDKGFSLAEMIKNELDLITEGIKISLVKLLINKERPLAEEVELSVPSAELKGRTVVLVDDVLNSGKTMAHSLKALLEVDLKKLEVAVLVNRSHKKYPMMAKYTGYELSTTIDDHVEVRLDKDFGVYLY